MSSHINYRFMDSDSKDMRMKILQMEVRKKTNALKRMEKVLKSIIQKDAISVDDMLHSDLLAIMKKQVPSTGDDDQCKFRDIFWKQQLQAFSKSNPKSIRWHPIIVKWCLYLHHKSSGAYETLRNSGESSCHQEELLEITDTSHLFLLGFHQQQTSSY